MTEWLEADGLGGFASGVVAGPRSRRYHALLLSARRPPVDRFVLVNGIEAWVEQDGRRTFLTSQRYLPDVVQPDGHRRIESFTAEPWPEWRFRIPNGPVVSHSVVVTKGRPQTLLSWRAEGALPADARLFVRPLMSGRDYHALHRENPVFDFEPRRDGETLRWMPYPGVPSVHVVSNGSYRQEPMWYRDFLYEDERRRGMDDVEDLASPGVFEFDLSKGEAFLLFSSETPVLPAGFAALRESERARRAAFRTPLDRAADAYLVRRGQGLTLVAGYPWFTDWGRDTFIALRGLCLATGRLADAETILLEWSRALSDGMLPNRFPDAGERPEFNSVDASLWFIVACHDYLRIGERAGKTAAPATAKALNKTCETIVAAYRRGARFGIAAGPDGLLASGTPGSQLTWMDARNNGVSFTPRVGKPVEVQALWIAALMHVSRNAPGWAPLRDRAAAGFQKRFWNAERRCLYDVVDDGHRKGAVDPSLRPNQLFAVGGLPWTLLDLERAGQVVAAVEKDLLTPVGLRTLAPTEPGYRGRYEGSPFERDAAYHQGTAWPWLMGAFVEGWVRAHGDDARAKREARARFLVPLAAHLNDAGVGHLTEIANGDAPHFARGCPFQAWSLGEYLRLDQLVLD